MIDMVQIALDSKIEAKLVLEDPDIEERKVRVFNPDTCICFLFSYFFKVSVKNIIPNITDL